MTNDENTYIGMSLPEGIRYITVFEKGDFENCGRILRTFYRTEDRVRKLLALGNLLHLGGSLSSNENKTSCWPLNNGNPIHEAKEISGKEKFFLLGDWTYLYENGRWFLGYEGKWVILLALTSNKGSHDFQFTQDAEGERLFEKVLRKSQEWAGDDRMMYVVGATQGRAFEDIRKIVPNHFLLVPGVGAQGGSLEEVCKYGMNSTCGLIVNSSRGIIYVDKTEKFAEAARTAAQEVQAQMAEQLKAIL